MPLILFFFVNSVLKSNIPNKLLEARCTFLGGGRGSGGAACMGRKCILNTWCSVYRSAFYSIIFLQSNGYVLRDSLWRFHITFYPTFLSKFVTQAFFAFALQ
jgi:hypothetical protein